MGSENDNKYRLVTLLTDLPAQIIKLIRLEAENFKAEVSLGLKSLGLGVAGFVVILVLLGVVAQLFVVLFIVLLNLFMPLWLSVLVTILIVVLKIAVIYVWSKSKVKKNSFVPTKTLASVQKDFEVIRDRVAGTIKEDI